MARFEAFWSIVCDYREFVWLGLTTLLFLFVLSVVGLVLSPPGSGSRAISYVNVALVLVTGALLGSMYWICLERTRGP